MATEEAVHRRTLHSAGDLSAKQYCWMTIDSAGRAATAAEGGNAVGVLQNKPAAIDREAAVWVGGTVKCLSAATIAAGDKVTCDSNGATVGIGSGDDYQLGTAREAAVTGQIFSVEIDKRGLS